MNILNGQNLFDVSGKTVLVTGAARGLGEGYAHIFAESGCNVACADIQFEKVQETAADIRSQGYEAQAFEVDVT
ncbi:MAG: SDR family NAD(P)-dependent oxidoreductase, partial [Ruminococcus sp.]|nr:SDR family NAD(P)-dependent oxidoreductase [Ruminococcus sp.]